MSDKKAIENEEAKIRAFMMFKTDEGKLVLEYLKETNDFDLPCCLANQPDKMTFFRDGVKSVISQIEFVTRNREDLLYAIREEGEHGPSSYADTAII